MNILKTLIMQVGIFRLVLPTSKQFEVGFLFNSKIQCMIELPIIQNNEHLDICSACGGSCCKNYAGWYHPEQVLTILESYKNTGELSPGYKIDAYEAEVYVLRPTHTNSPDSDEDFSWGGQCVHFEDKKGCSLTFEQRPLQCQSLTCSEPEIAKTGLSKSKIKEYWKEYQHYFD